MLLSEREALMSEIALRASLGSLPAMLAKARKLLTNFWARANWETRSELLAAARMLLVLGAAQPALKQGVKAAGPKRGPGRPAAARQRKPASSRRTAKVADPA